MANLTESPIYEPGIFQLEKSTPALGGAPVIDSGVPSAGHANAQALQLANRTAYLKDITDNLTGPTASDNIPYDSTTVSEQLSKARKLYNYTALRAYSGSASRVEITQTGVNGFYQSLGVVSGYTDDGGFHVISTNGVVWERQFVGNIQAIWFRDGSSDDTTASSKAAQAAASFALDSDGDYPLVPYCPWAIVELPTNWTVSSEVDTSNKEIVWKVPVSCNLVGAQFLNGRILREGSKITDFHHGILDSAATFSVMSNTKLDEVAAVGGIGTASRLSAGNGRDSVTAYYSNRVAVPTYSTAAVSSYTASAVILAAPMTDTQMRRMRRGMIIQTRHTTKYAGYVGSWTSTQINVVGGWFLVDGTPVGTATTPTGTDGVDINVFRKAWALNANCFIDANSYGSEAVGVEIGVSNAKAQSTGMGGNIATYGGLFASLQADANDYYNTYATITGGRWVNGYTSIGGVRTAFNHIGSLGRTDELQNLISGTTSGAINFFNVDSLGNIEAGRRGGGVTSTLVIDGHSSGNVNDYDGRISLTGGTSAAGAGIWSFTAGQVTLNAAATDFVGVPRPSVDNTYTLGQAARRWTTVYASTGTINTSDERYKTEIQDISDAVLDAWSEVDFKQYKFKDSVEAKGKNARLHFGVLAQKVQQAFESHSLDAFSYGVLCYDEWEGQDEVVESWEDKYEEVVIKDALMSQDQTQVIEPEVRELRLIRNAGSKVITEKSEAGNRYGVRYEEAMVLEMALLRRTTARLEKRIQLMETK